MELRQHIGPPALCVAMAVMAAVLTAGAQAGNTDLVTTDGHHFELNDRPYYFVGANLWQGMNLAASGSSGDRARLARELDRLRAAGVTNLRIMAASEGPDSEPYRMVPSLQTAPGTYNADVFNGLDYLLDQMNQRNMRAVMVLNNFWHWSGGMSQYVSWSKGTAIPYPNDTGDWQAYMEYARQFYTDAQCQAWYRDYVDTLIGRVNSVNGRNYADDPTVFSWELANEPRRFPADWIDDTAAYIKSLDSNHLVTTGFEGEAGTETWLAGWEDRTFVETHNGLNIDYATMHIWPENWGWYDPTDPTTYAAGEAQAVTYFQTHEQAALNDLGKPVVLEEFGLARDGWLGWDHHDPAAPTSNRDTFYNAMFDEVYASAASDGSAGGDHFWAWGGEGRPGDPDPQWIGDPPHETPGWYSVYDVDSSTQAIIASHAEHLHNLIPVPEPSGLGLIGIGVLGLRRRRV